MNNQDDAVGGLLVQLAQEGKISPEAAGLTGDMVMPTMQQEPLIAEETTALPETPVMAEATEIEPEPEAQTDTFYSKIATNAEAWHGATPVKTKDPKESDKPENERTSDIAFGHKIKDSEWESGEIHGIRFLDDQGNPIPLTEEQGYQILQKDFEENVRYARRNGWDAKLEKIGSSWEELDPKYQKALASLAFNVGGTKAGQKWEKVLQAAANENVELFAKEMRRQDSGKHTEGMDNRVAKELYYAGIIDSFAEVASVLPLASARVAGVPNTKDVENVT